MDYELKILQDKIDDEHQDSLWYGGRIAEIKYKGYTFIVGAYGDVVATLWGRNNDGSDYELAYVKDKNNAGRFYEEMSPYIKSDVDIGRKEAEGKLVLDNNNWFEVLIDGPDGEQYDLGWVCDDFTYDSAIQEVIDNMENTIKDIESLK